MLLDTSGLLCYFDLNDARHEEALTCFNSTSFHLTHSYALAEFVPLCRARGMNVSGALVFMEDLMGKD